MGAAPRPARLVVSLLAGHEQPRAQALRRLASALGRVVSYSEPINFTKSAYYTSEMGPGLDRRLAALEDLRLPGELAGIKCLCQQIETDLSLGGRRQVNLDPGLLDRDSLVLATHKFSGHRLELAPGIYGEVTLYYMGGGYKALPWTYPDYAGEQMRDLLEHLRGRLLWQGQQQQARGDIF
ncbi:MAG: DUF4416 family protein [Proteobacteria bacterium]|nr:DUF4416 family protein [Pseudomonadota bacterium]MBU1449929.1 DUF4416 family protein [Pseudomonadota bacterium]MBU2468049.1 DUF4416 family protein [Pseudomonadota bacterium]MBU2518810.1 DUF4416 family protein [Pseudomonadota bacterium]